MHYLFLTLLLCWTTSAKADEAKALLSRIEDQSSTEKPNKAFSLQMSFPIDDTTGVQMDVCWRGNGVYSCLISERESQLPVALFTNNQFFLYDVVDGRMLVGTGVAPMLSFATKQLDDETKLVFEYTFGIVPESKPAFDFALRSLLTQSHDVSQFKAEDSLLHVSFPSPSTSTPSIVNCCFKNVGSPFVPQLSSIRIHSDGGDNGFSNDEDNELITFSNLKNDASAELVPFPNLDSLPVRISRWDKSDELPAMLELYNQVMRSISGIAALSNENCRKLSIFAEDIDWNEVQTRANKVCALLSVRLGRSIGGMRSR